MNTHTPDIVVAIYLYGDKLDPDYISNALGVSPSRTRKKGKFHTASGEHISKTGVWVIETEATFDNVSAQIDELLTKIGRSNISVTSICGVERACLDVLFIGPEENEPRRTVALLLSSKQVEVIARLNLAIQFTSY